jgi:predicted ATPase
MHLDQFAPFPRASVNLITCASNSGKTHLLQKIFHSPGAFIEDHASIRRIIYINCNKRDIGFIHPWQQDPLDEGAFELITLGIEQLSEFEDVVERGDAVILDDLLTLSEAIYHLINYAAHHYNLTVFIVTQSCLASPLYSLVSSAHNIVLFFKNSSTSRLAHHLLHQYFYCSATKKYLRDIFAQAERDKCILVLKINCVATSPHHKAILAYSHIEGLFEDTLPHCRVYPELGYREAVMEEASLRKIKVPAKLAASLSGSDTFILVPAKNVLVEEEEEEEEGEKMKKEASCLQRDWEEMVEFLENEIESSFPFKRWIHAKNLLRELLRCSDLCISADYRLCLIKNQSASKQKHFSIVDFLNLATRHSAPGEMLSQKMLDFVPLVRILLAHAIPHTYIPNKILLQQALAHGGRVKKHVHK